MYADLGPGQEIDLDPPPPNGVDVLYSHDYVASRTGLSDNLYQYSDGNPVNLTDPSGLTPRIQFRAERAYFLTWYTANKTTGLGWLKGLPDCPCTLTVKCVRVRYKWFLWWEWGHTEYNVFNNPDGKEWTDPEKASSLHPGAAVCMRSKNAIANGAGQQCCYDSDGDLLTHGRGAGTPDQSAPIGADGIARHVLKDVKPFLNAASLDSRARFGGFVDKYLEVRPPNQGKDAAGKPCPKNP